MTQALNTSTHFMLPPSLQDLHVKTLAWESSLELWKRELLFFQKLIDHYGSQVHRRTDIEEREHFKLLLNYYSNDLMGSLKKKMLAHEANLKKLLKNGVWQDEASYRDEHRDLELRIHAFEQEFMCYKNELYLLLEKVLQKNKQNKILS